jgi:diacylglycerol kinase
MAIEPMNHPAHDKPRHALMRSFGYAFTGLAHMVRTQRNARIEIVAAIIACALSAWLHISREDWAILTLTIAMVLILEGVNTAIEIAVDLSTPQRHPMAKTAKDIAAGIVLVAAMASIIVGLLVLAPLLWNKLVK